MLRYLFTFTLLLRVALGWVENSQIIRPVTDTNGYFAKSVAIHGTKMIATHDRDNTQASNAGAAYSYQWDGTEWVQDATKLYASDPEASDKFGTAVAMYGDYAAVGAQLEDTEGSSAGAVYTFQWSGSAWVIDSQVLRPTELDASDYFGRGVAMGDGTMAITAYGYGTTGAIFTYRWVTDQWVRDAPILTPSGSTNTDLLIPVAISGDKMAVGAYSDDGVGDASADSGAVYTYTWSGTAWVQDAAVLRPAGLVAGDNFGYSVAFDGPGRLIASAPADDVATSNGGAAYVFEWGGSSWDQVQVIRPVTASLGSTVYAGTTIGANGGVLAIAAAGESTGGEVFTYTWVTDSYTNENVVSGTGVTTGDNFGNTLALHGEHLAVSADRDDHHASNSGALFTFTGTPTGAPTDAPTNSPTLPPVPTKTPTNSPTNSPTKSPTKTRYTLTKSNLKLGDLNGTRRALVVQGALDDVDAVYGTNAPTTHVTKTVSSTERSTFNFELVAAVGDEATLLAAIEQVRCGQAECSISFDRRRRVLQSSPVVHVELTFSLSAELYNTVDGFNFDDPDFIEALRTELGLNNETAIEVAVTGADIEIDVVVASEKDDDDPLGEDLIQLARNIEERLAQTASTLAVQLGGSAEDITSTYIDLCPQERDCAGNGTCDDATGVCVCDAPFRGVNCESTCSCLNGGACDGSYCVCNGLYYGHSCQLERDCQTC